jgi:hypothetical protein
VRASFRDCKVVLMSSAVCPIRVFGFFGFTPLFAGDLMPRGRLVPELDVTPRVTKTLKKVINK